MAKHKRHYDEGGDVSDDFDSETGAKYSSQAEDIEPSTPAPKAAAKSAVVTKEQLAASGYDNLRDYLNAQKGLKRRDGSAPAKSGPSSYSEMLRNAPAGTSDTAMKALKSNAANESNRLADAERGVSRGRKSAAEAPKMTRSAPRKPYSPEPMGTSFPGSRFSKGGMASPSKRADGIARKGLTKCACGGGRM